MALYKSLKSTTSPNYSPLVESTGNTTAATSKQSQSPPSAEHCIRRRRHQLSPVRSCSPVRRSGSSSSSSSNGGTQIRFRAGPPSSWTINQSSSSSKRRVTYSFSSGTSFSSRRRVAAYSHSSSSSTPVMNGICTCIRWITTVWQRMGKVLRKFYQKYCQCSGNSLYCGAGTGVAGTGAGKSHVAKHTVDSFRSHVDGKSEDIVPIPVNVNIAEDYDEDNDDAISTSSSSSGISSGSDCSSIENDSTEVVAVVEEKPKLKSILVHRLPSSHSHTRRSSSKSKSKRNKKEYNSHNVVDQERAARRLRRMELYRTLYGNGNGNGDGDGNVDHWEMPSNKWEKVEKKRVRFSLQLETVLLIPSRTSMRWQLFDLQY